MLELGLQQLWEYVTLRTHDAHLQMHETMIRLPGSNVTRANREEHATPKHIEKFVFCLTGPYLVTSTHNEAGWATPHRAARYESDIGLLW